MTLPYALEDYLPSTGDVGVIVADEIAALGGTLVDVVDDGGRLFVRALLADTDDVTPGDTIHGGIAIRVQGPSVTVQAYTLRQVCSNGAMGARPADAFRVERAPAGTPIELVTPVHDTIRDAVRRCAESPAFVEAIVRMRVATQSEAPRAMYVLPQLLHAMSLHAPPEWHDRVLYEVMHRFAHGRDRSLFGLLNAVTSTARDETDPARRWALEELGGQLLVGAMVPRRVQAGRRPLDGTLTARELVEAGA